MHKIPQGVSEASFSPCTIFQENFEGRPLPFFGQAVNATFAVVSFDAHCCELRVGPLTLQRYDFLAAGWRNGRIAGEELVYFPTPKNRHLLGISIDAFSGSQCSNVLGCASQFAIGQSSQLVCARTGVVCDSVGCSHGCQAVINWDSRPSTLTYPFHQD